MSNTVQRTAKGRSNVPWAQWTVRGVEQNPLQLKTADQCQINRCNRLPMAGTSFCRQCMAEQFRMKIEYHSADSRKQKNRVTELSRLDATPRTNVIIRAARFIAHHDKWQLPFGTVDEVVLTSPFVAMVRDESGDGESVGSTAFHLDTALLLTAAAGRAPNISISVDRTEEPIVVATAMREIRENDELLLDRVNINDGADQIPVKLYGKHGFAHGGDKPYARAPPAERVAISADQRTTSTQAADVQRGPHRSNSVHAPETNALRPATGTTAACTPTRSAQQTARLGVDSHCDPCKRAKKSVCASHQNECQWVPTHGCVNRDTISFQFDPTVTRNARLDAIRRTSNLMRNHIFRRAHSTHATVSSAHHAARTTNPVYTDATESVHATTHTSHKALLAYTEQALNTKLQWMDVGGEANNTKNACLYIAVITALMTVAPETIRKFRGPIQAKSHALRREIDATLPPEYRTIPNAAVSTDRHITKISTLIQDVLFTCTGVADPGTVLSMAVFCNGLQYPRIEDCPETRFVGRVHLANIRGHFVWLKEVATDPRVASRPDVTRTVDTAIGDIIVSIVEHAKTYFNRQVEWIDETVTIEMFHGHPMDIPSLCASLAGAYMHGQKEKSNVLVLTQTLIRLVTGMPPQQHPVVQLSQSWFHGQLITISGNAIGSNRYFTNAIRNGQSQQLSAPQIQHQIANLPETTQHIPLAVIYTPSSKRFAWLKLT